MHEILVQKHMKIMTFAQGDHRISSTDKCIYLMMIWKEINITYVKWVHLKHIWQQYVKMVHLLIWKTRVQKKRKGNATGASCEGSSAKVHHHYISAGPMYKKDSTILFIRKNYPKTIYNMLYLGQGCTMCNNVRGYVQNAPTLKYC